MRLRLVLLVLATTSLVLTAFLLPLALLIRTFAADRAVAGAVAQAQSLTPVVATVSGNTLTLAVDQLNAASPDQPVTVFLPDGATVGARAQASAGVRLARSGRSITAQVPGGLEVLVSVQGLPGDATASGSGLGGTAVIRVFVPDSVLRHGVVRAWLLLAAVGLGLLALSALVADRLARSLVRPLADLAGASDRLAEGDLTARAEPAGPREVQRVGTALNGLAVRMGELLAREREYSADLSHRLRTPLTALRIDAEGIADPESRDRIGEGVDAVEGAVNEIIRELRRPAREGVWVTCDAAAVVDERASFWSALAEEQQRPMTVRTAPGPLPVRVGSEDLAAAVDVLLDNVFAHTPDGTAFALELVARPAGGARLSVDDAGPGLSGRTAVHRGVSGEGSTGLGLDIARRTAACSGGALTVGSGTLGGARVTLELGPPLEPKYRRGRRRHRAASRSTRGS
ncbi:MAG TPA: HAMP domain-containing sensor histidine kinase [Actinocrinis sp.]|jgi:signal transduction histidine kinase|uniref:sensor histidine kinase n=1 Tax=Actinocrinis sp. TaxID=1920516 RepID=UPI002DDC948C|nr:HAMP domain-containing sensor histidine kinase [Actinocrinis sp.]HEV3169638.1 HAMP domain-containing sensor histidine kinase [Actinocrinis sp.]